MSAKVAYPAVARAQNKHRQHQHRKQDRRHRKQARQKGHLRTRQRQTTAYYHPRTRRQTFLLRSRGCPRHWNTRRTHSARARNHLVHVCHRWSCPRRLQRPRQKLRAPLVWLVHLRDARGSGGGQHLLAGWP